MKNAKRLFYFLLLNVLVSAGATLAVLYFWEQAYPGTSRAGLFQGGQADPKAAATAEITATLSVALPGMTGGGTPEAAAPTADPFENVEEYRVRNGDTLGTIAQQYNVDVKEIMKLNGLKNADSIGVGQVLYIPLPVPPTEKPAPTASPTIPAPTITPGGPVVVIQLTINSVIAPGDLANEHVFISRGPGDAVLSLAGWQLVDGNGNVYIFPQLDLFGDGAVNVWSKVGSNTVVDLYWGLPEPVWSSGETVTLRDGDGKVRATYTIP